MRVPSAIAALLAMEAIFGQEPSPARLNKRAIDDRAAPEVTAAVLDASEAKRARKRQRNIRAATKENAK